MRFVISLFIRQLFSCLGVRILAHISTPEERDNGKVVLKKAILVIGLICTAAFIILALITALSYTPLWPSVMFAGFAVLSATMIIAYYNCRIWYDDKGFTVKSFCGTKRRYSYADITAIKENANEDIVYIGRHRVMIDELAIGRYYFITFANARYQQLYGKPIPIINKRKQ